MMITVFEADIRGTEVTAHRYSHREPIYTINISVGNGDSLTLQFDDLAKLQEWICTVYNGVSAIVDEATGNVPVEGES